jgi:hypothetical protein
MGRPLGQEVRGEREDVVRFYKRLRFFGEARDRLLVDADSPD